MLYMVKNILFLFSSPPPQHQYGQSQTFDVESTFYDRHVDYTLLYEKGKKKRKLLTNCGVNKKRKNRQRSIVLLWQ